MPIAKGKILVIRGGAIGDFILTLPVFAALREQFPQTQLEVLGYPHIAQLALAGGLVDAVQSIEARALAGFFARGGTLEPRLGDYFASFAVVISYLYDPDQIFQANVARCSKAQFIIGPHRPDEMLNLHATEVLLKPLERLAIFAHNPLPKLKIAPQSVLSDPVQRKKPICLALHPGSGSEKKNWPESKWMELLKQLATDTNWNVLLVGGEAEGDRLPRLKKLFPATRLEVAQSLPLTDLASRLRNCDFFLGHDSGISHLAAALGLSGLVLWGETNLNIWSPRSDRFEILKPNLGLAHLEPRQVTAELLQRVSC